LASWIFFVSSGTASKRSEKERRVSKEEGRKGKT
jgi:hypothetical protein